MALNDFSFYDENCNCSVRSAIGLYLAHLGDAEAAKFFTNEGPTAA
jgi:hypothetical protein